MRFREGFWMEGVREVRGELEDGVEGEGEG